jgi:hypothetical protein
VTRIGVLRQLFALQFGQLNDDAGSLPPSCMIRACNDYARAELRSRQRHDADVHGLMEHAGGLCRKWPASKRAVAISP